jgi:predicted DCC family thiol-disulfide oxidoreductase YuxK
MTRMLLYDGSCGLCARSVQFILNRERRDRSLLFAPLQGTTAATLLHRHPELAGADSVVWIEENDGESRIRLRSEAALAAAAYLGGPWKALARLLRLVPRFVRDAGYDMVARTRYRRFGRDSSCLLPTAAQRRRFLD